MQLHMEMYPKDSPLRALTSRGGFSHKHLDPKKIKMMRNVGDNWDKLYHEGHKPNDRRLQGYANPFAGGGNNNGFSDEGPSFGTGIQATDAPEGITENTFGLMGATLEEARTVLDMARMCSKETGTDLQVDPDITTGIGAADFLAEFGACEADAAADDFNPLELAAC